MLTINPEQHVLFVGDVIGSSGVEYLERQLPRLKRDHQADLVVVNGENAHPGADGDGASGLGPREAARLFAAGADVITGGNHSWDARGATEALALPNVLRPLNAMPECPGVGATVVVRAGIRYGVVNLASRTAIPSVAHPLPCLERQIEAWVGVVDAIVVDFHAASVSEKLTLAYAVAGRVSAVIGTHTHVPTADLRVLPGGTAYVTDVGMTGPEESLQGYDPSTWVEAYRAESPVNKARVASGPLTLGAVMVYLAPPGAVDIRRVATPPMKLHGAFGAGADWRWARG